MSLYTIAQVSEEVDLTPYTLRYYEKEGLLPNVTKDSAGRRKYHDDDLQRIGQFFASHHHGTFCDQQNLLSH